MGMKASLASSRDPVPVGAALPGVLARPPMGPSAHPAERAWPGMARMLADPAPRPASQKVGEPVTLPPPHRPPWPARGRNRSGQYADRAPQARALFYYLRLNALTRRPGCCLFGARPVTAPRLRAVPSLGQERRPTAQALSQNQCPCQGSPLVSGPPPLLVPASRIRLSMNRKGVLEGSGLCLFPITTGILAASTLSSSPRSRCPWTQSPHTCLSRSRTRLPRPAPGAPGLLLPQERELRLLGGRGPSWAAGKGTKLKRARLHPWVSPQHGSTIGLKQASPR